VLLETVSPDDTVGLNMGCHCLDPEIPERGISGELTQSYERERQDAGRVVPTGTWIRPPVKEGSSQPTDL